MMHDPEEPYAGPPPRIRVPTSTVFTFEKAELEQMIRDSVVCPPGMYLQRISFEVEAVYDPDPRDTGPPSYAFSKVNVHFSKLQPGR